MGNAALDLRPRRPNEKTARAKLEDRARQRRKQLIKRARVDPVAFIEFVLVDEVSQLPLHCAQIHRDWQTFLTANPWAVLVAPVEHGKAMPLDTPVATPEGFVPIGDLVGGDVVYGRDGRPYAVQMAHAPWRDRQVFEFEFDDGGTVRSDLDHLWAVWNQDDLDEGREPRVTTTRKIVERGVKRGRDFFWKVPIAEAVQYPAQPLPIDPYVLGCWLGDGTATNASLTLHEDDYELAERCLAIEGAVATPRRDKRRPKVLTVNLGGSTPKTDNLKAGRLRQRLRDLGVLGDKHIPAAYLLGSVDQRRALLAGLLDTDGSVCGTRGQSRVEFGSSIERLALQVLELVRSLGFKAKLVGPSKTKHWRVTFTAREPVFRLQRKLDLQKLDRDRTRTRHRTIVAIREVERQDTRCITVASPDGTFIVGQDYTVTHNTSQLVGRVLWEIGKNPNIRIGWISLGEEQAIKVIGIVRRYIEESKRLREVFPRLCRSTREGHSWNKHALEVERSPFLRDPTIRAYGQGTKIPGARLDLVVCDDVLDEQNTHTLELSQGVISWFDTSVLTRVQDDVRTGVRARLWVMGTPWADHDLLHALPKRKSFASRVFSAVLNPQDKPNKWIPCWPEQWPLKRLLIRLNGMLPSAFARKYLCRVVNDINSRFPEWAINMALEAGRGLTFLQRRPLLWPGPRGLRCWTGVDLGVGEKEGDDLTALVTVALRDDMRRQLVKIESGNWTSDEIMDRIVETYYRYESRVIVESVAAQRFLLQFVRKHRKIPVEPYNTTGQNKWDEAFGIESIAVELRQKLWIFPSGDNGNEIDPEMAALRFEMLSYRPNLHTGDRLMGLWFAREGIRRTLGKKFR